jgi:hypothetical protein
MLKLILQSYFLVRESEILSNSKAGTDIRLLSYLAIVYDYSNLYIPWDNSLLQIDNSLTTDSQQKGR